MNLPRRVPAIAILSLGILTTVLGAVGSGLVPLWSVALVAGFHILARRLPVAQALALAVVAFFGVELLLLTISPYLGLGILVPNIILWTSLTCAAMIVEILRPPERRRKLSWSRGVIAIAASASAITAVVALGAAQIVPGALRLAWAMNGDAVNAMGFARQMILDGGIRAVMPQATPLPFAMAAANMASGRDALSTAAVLEHDVLRTAQLWVFVIALSCCLVGAIVAQSTRSNRLRWRVPVVVLSSTSVLAWYVIGVQFEFGFMNSAFAVALLLAVWLIFESGSGHPIATLSGLTGAVFAMLAVWSPLVVCIIGLGVVSVWCERRSVAGLPRRAFTLPAIAAAVVVVYATTVTLQGFLRHSDALGSNGGFPPIGPASILVISALAFMASVLAGQAGAARDAFGVFSVIGGFAIGLTYLLLQRKGAAFAWGYYPAKFAWTTSILLIVIVIALSARLLGNGSMTFAWKGLATVALAGVAASMLWGPVSPSGQVPLVGILRGNAFGNQKAAEIVFQLAETQGSKNVLWRTKIGDFFPNTWLLQLNQPNDSPVKIYATVAELSADQVCSIVTYLGDRTVIHTSDPTAGSDLQKACPSARYSIIEGEY